MMLMRHALNAATPSVKLFDKVTVNVTCVSRTITLILTLVYHHFSKYFGNAVVLLLLVRLMAPHDTAIRDTIRYHTKYRDTI